MIDKIFAETLKHGTTLYSKRLKNADGTPMRARVTGKCKVWKSRPNEFQLPVKHGLRDSGYVTHHNGDMWTTTEPVSPRSNEPEEEE